MQQLELTDTQPTTWSEEDEQFDARLNRFELHEESIGNEVRLFGPPGTGKTTYLSRVIPRAVQRYGRKGAMVMSLTRSAARELAGREMDIDEDAIGTLHSHTWHALGRPTLVETKRKVWNAAYPQWALRGSRVDPDVDEQVASGDALLHELGVNRARMVPTSEYPMALRRFWEAWTDFKQQTSSYDFTDLIDICLRDVAMAPGNPEFIAVDEGQDFTRQQMALVRKWAKGIDMLMTAGDEDQLLYRWTGADIRTMLEPVLHSSQIRVLRQSYRIPAAVHRVAVQWIEQITYRQPKVFAPRAEEGKFRGLPVTSEDPQGIVDEAQRLLEKGKTVMILAACRFTLNPIIAELRGRGQTFHNPYRREDGGLNPFETRGTGTAQRLLAFLEAQRSQWTVRQVADWVDPLRAKGLLQHGAKKVIEETEKDRYVTEEDLAQWFEANALDSMLLSLEAGPVTASKWWMSRVLDKSRGPAEFATRVIEARGVVGLEEKPRLVIGTVHSVKGAGADAVILLPDVTRTWAEDWMNGGEDRDSLIRLFYVGMTRAIEELIVCDAPRRGNAIPLPAARGGRWS